MYIIQYYIFSCLLSICTYVDYSLLLHVDQEYEDTVPWGPLDPKTGGGGVESEKESDS